MTVPQVIAVAFLAFLNGFAIGVVLYRHYVMKPRWETEAELRKELGKVRGELWDAKLQAGDHFWYSQSIESATTTVPPAIKTRAHSDVLFVPHPEDLLK